jgi:hypothetical protein
MLSRTRFTKLDHNSYQLVFEFFSNTLGDDGINVLEYIKNLEAVLVDFSLSQAQGFKDCIRNLIGDEDGIIQAEQRLKECSVH